MTSLSDYNKQGIEAFGNLTDRLSDLKTAVQDAWRAFETLSEKVVEIESKLLESSLEESGRFIVYTVNSQAEARCLLGEKVYASDYYVTLQSADENLTKYTLLNVGDDSRSGIPDDPMRPFVLMDDDRNLCRAQFIRAAE